MNDVWERIESLEGRTLRTIAHGKEFEIVRVNRNRQQAVGIQVKPRGSMARPRSILRRNLEKAYDLKARGVLTGTADFPRNGIRTRNASYILAILEAAEASS